jgi:hypothetical protein
MAELLQRVNTFDHMGHPNHCRPYKSILPLLQPRDGVSSYQVSYMTGGARIPVTGGRPILWDYGV